MKKMPAKSAKKKAMPSGKGKRGKKETPEDMQEKGMPDKLPPFMKKKKAKGKKA